MQDAHARHAMEQKELADARFAVRPAPATLLRRGSFRLPSKLRMQSDLLAVNVPVMVAYKMAFRAILAVLLLAAHTSRISKTLRTLTATRTRLNQSI